MKAALQESSENYLETILILSRHSGRVRSVDIANELDFTRPSVSIAMKKLRENGLIEVNFEGFITLTDEGRNVAESIYERHMIISDWLISLGVDEKTARYDACRIEHVISKQSFLAIKKYISNY